MSHLTLLEQARAARLAAGHVRRSSVARMLASPLLRWRYGAPIAEALAMVPQQLRPADPSFVEEIARGTFGLAGEVASLGAGSPFDAPPPSAAWSRALHGFDWLRHLNAARSETATAAARSLVDAWIARDGARQASARLPDVAGRRLISWLANADLLLEGVDQATFDRTAQCLGDELITLSASWSSAPDGHPRLLALLGVVYGDLCIVGHERHLAVAQTQLAAELRRQVLPDGGHITRNCSVVLDLLLDLLPLRQCFVASGRPLPGEIDAAVARMTRMLATMRLGDGTLARFNGVVGATMAELSTVLAYAPAGTAPLAEAPHSGYARLEASDVVLIADVGDAPPIELAGQAQAGVLSFELSAGSQAILVNGGMPAARDQQHTAAARSTASHSALRLADRSSARLLRNTVLEQLVGGEPIRLQGTVAARIERSAQAVVLTATYDGWVGEHGLLHTRRLTLGADGGWLEGSDWLAGAKGAVRLARDVPFAIAFHLHPRVRCDGTADAGGAVTLALPDGTTWRFRVTGAALSVEPSWHFAEPAGAVRSRQLVARGACWGETMVEWRLERVDVG